MNRVKSKGFSTFVVLVVIVTIAAIGFGGWYVYKAKHNKDDKSKSSATSQSSSSTKSKTSTSTKKSDPTASWTTYSSGAGQYSFRYPTTWVTATHPDQCNEGLVLLGPTPQTVGVCATESFGEVSVSSTDGDRRADTTLDASLYTNIQTSNVTVSNVVGTRTSGTAQNQANILEVGALPDGTNVVDYVFYTNNKTYAISYEQHPSYPNVLSDFELLVTNTFKFAP